MEELYKDSLSKCCSAVCVLFLISLVTAPLSEGCTSVYTTEEKCIRRDGVERFVLSCPSDHTVSINTADYWISKTYDCIHRDPYITCHAKGLSRLFKHACVGSYCEVDVPYDRSASCPQASGAHYAKVLYRCEAAYNSNQLVNVDLCSTGTHTGTMAYVRSSAQAISGGVIYNSNCYCTVKVSPQAQVEVKALSLIKRPDRLTCSQHVSLATYAMASKESYQLCRKDLVYSAPCAPQSGANYMLQYITTDTSVAVSFEIFISASHTAPFTITCGLTGDPPSIPPTTSRGTTWQRPTVSTSTRPTPSTRRTAPPTSRRTNPTIAPTPYPSAPTTRPTPAPPPTPRPTTASTARTSQVVPYTKPQSTFVAGPAKMSTDMILIIIGCTIAAALIIGIILIAVSASKRRKPRQASHGSTRRRRPPPPPPPDDAEKGSPPSIIANGNIYTNEEAAPNGVVKKGKKDKKQKDNKSKRYEDEGSSIMDNKTIETDLDSTYCTSLPTPSARGKRETFNF